MTKAKNRNYIWIWTTSKILTLLFFLLQPLTSIAQPWDLSPLFKAARKGAKIGYEGLERIQKMSETLTSRKQAQETTSMWQKIAGQFREAADKIQRAPLPSDFNMELFKLDVPAIDCATKQTVITTATSYLEELKKSQINSHFMQEQTATFINTLGIARKNLDVLREFYYKILSTEIWTDWLDIEHTVHGDLFRLTEAANKHLMKLRQEFKKVEMKISNLSGNLAEIEQMKCGGTFTCQNKTFPNNTVTQSDGCRWNFNLKELSVVINIAKDEKSITSSSLQFIEAQEPLDKCDLRLSNFHHEFGLKYSSITKNIINVEFIGGRIAKVFFIGTKQKNIINGSIIIETLPGAAEKLGHLPYRIVQLLTLNRQ